MQRNRRTHRPILSRPCRPQTRQSRRDRPIRSRRLCERAHRTAVSSLQGDVSRRSHRTSASNASGRSSRSTTTRAITLTREEIERRPKNLWRYRELLPIAGEPRTGFNSGLHAARPLRSRSPSGSASASCTSRTTRSTIRRCRTRIASSRSRRRAPSSSGSRCWRARRPATSPTASRRTPRGSASSAACSSPTTSKPGKLLGSAIFGPTILAIAGNYDDVNRLCTQVADRYGWGFVNINLRSYYAEGAKTMGFEIVEQLGWRYPQHLVSPVAGGTLLPRIVRGLARAARRSASSRASCRASTRRRRPAARRSSTRSRPASIIRSRCGPTRSPSRSRSAIRPTAIR